MGREVLFSVETGGYEGGGKAKDGGASGAITGPGVIMILKEKKALMRPSFSVTLMPSEPIYEFNLGFIE